MTKQPQALYKEEEKFSLPKGSLISFQKWCSTPAPNDLEKNAEPYEAVDIEGFIGDDWCSDSPIFSPEQIVSFAKYVIILCVNFDLSNFITAIAVQASVAQGKKCIDELFKVKSPDVSKQELAKNLSLDTRIENSDKHSIVEIMKYAVSKC